MGIINETGERRLRVGLVATALGIAVLSSAVHAHAQPQQVLSPALVNAEPKDARPDRIFGVLPNYTTVEHEAEIDPVTTKATFRMAALSSFDPYVFPFVGFVAALPGGSASYARRYGTALADNSIGNFLTTAIVPTVLKQDPRYFELGEGGVWRRLGYAASRSIITRSRGGQRAFNYSEIGGNAIAAVISNAYYPSASRSLSDTLTRWGMQVLWDTLSNELKEFWPDIRRKLHNP
jgi:hypothetical protein